MRKLFQAPSFTVHTVGYGFDGSHREGRRMRRTSAMLVVLLSGVTGCSGTEAQVPYDRLVAVAQRPARTAPAPAVQVPEAEPIAPASNAPWAIALLSDAPERPIKRSGKVTIVEAEPVPGDEPEVISHEADVHVAFEPEAPDEKPADEKPAAPKACSGVVNRRS
jgi:hypothetical protein